MELIRHQGGYRLCLIACLVLATAVVGCRKSQREFKEERQEEYAEFQEAQWQFEQAEARARSLYEQGKDFQRAGRYQDALEVWKIAVESDERVGLMVDLAKNLMAGEMVDRAHYRMHRPYENAAYPRLARETLLLITNPQNGFLDKHIAKAVKELEEWQWIKGGWAKYARAQRLIDTHQLAEGLDILESICKNYPRTPLADQSIKLLKQYGRN